MKVNDMEKARAHLIKATELTDNENAFMALVKLYVMEDRIIDAIAVYSQALKSVTTLLINFVRKLISIIMFAQSQSLPIG